MLLSCETCNQKYKLNVTELKSTATKARCSKCRTIFKLPKLGDPIAKACENTSGKIISVSNRKGGVAKTSTCMNLGYSLSHMGKRVLMIDLDAQANLTTLMGYRNVKSFYDTVSSGSALSRAILQSRYPGLSILPANPNLVFFNKNHFGKENYEYILKKALATITEQYDYILIDTPPAIEFSTINAATAAHLVLIPSQCDYLATHGIQQVLEMICMIRAETNPALDYRILITMYQAESNISRTIRRKYDAIYRGKTSKTVIELDDKLRESQIVNSPVLNYEKTSRSALQYLELAREITSAN